MTTLANIRTLFDYDQWATNRILESVQGLSEEQYTRDLGSSFGGVRGTLIHILGAEMIWLERWKGNSPSTLLTEKEFATFDALKKGWIALYDNLGTFLKSLTDQTIQQNLSYKDVRGNPYTQPLYQQLQHLVNHSTYHRGQVITLLRQLGVKPPSTDLIAYYREKS